MITDKKIIIKRISVEVSEEFLLRLKQRALTRNMSLKRYVIGVLSEQILKEEQYDKR